MPDTFAFTTIRIYKVILHLDKNVYVLTFIGVCYGYIYQFDVINSMSMLPFEIYKEIGHDRMKYSNMFLLLFNRFRNYTQYLNTVYVGVK